MDTRCHPVSKTVVDGSVTYMACQVCNGGVGRVVYAPDCESGLHRFESGTSPQVYIVEPLAEWLCVRLQPVRYRFESGTALQCEFKV